MTDAISEASRWRPSRRFLGAAAACGACFELWPAAVVAGLIDETIGNTVAIGWTIACAGATAFMGSLAALARPTLLSQGDAVNPWASKCLHCGIRLYRAKRNCLSGGLHQNVGPPAELQAAQQQDAADEPRPEWRLAADLGVLRTTGDDAWPQLISRRRVALVDVAGRPVAFRSSSSWWEEPFTSIGGRGQA